MDKGGVAYLVQLKEVEGQEGQHEGQGVGDVEQFKDDYCLAKVDEDGLVRKVTVSYRKENPRESPQVYNSKHFI